MMIKDGQEDSAVPVPHADLQDEQDQNVQLTLLEFDLTHTSTSRRKIR